jgi:hypothetical protein
MDQHTIRSGRHRWWRVGGSVFDGSSNELSNMIFEFFYVLRAARRPHAKGGAGLNRAAALMSPTPAVDRTRD